MTRSASAKEDYYDLVEQIKQLPILPVFERYVGGQLRRLGNKAVAPCPWHGRDSSPSLTLYVQRGNWYCYGCQKGGTVIDLVMAALGVNFKAAISTMAHDYGLNSTIAGPEIRQERAKVRQQYAIESSFADAYDRIFSELLARRDALIITLQTYFDYDDHPDLVNEQSILEYVIDEIADARTSEEKLGAWRLARKVFPWLKA